MTFRERITSWRTQYKKKTEHPFWELLSFAVMAFIIILPIRAFVAQPFIVSGSSMYPTFENGDYLIIDQISYKLENPERGDVVVFRYPKDPKKFFIKRIIGLPNETVEIKAEQIFIKNDKHKDGFPLNDPFTNVMKTNDMSITLKEGQYFVMGDNRNASSDSRSWGTLPEDLITGKAFLRLLPIKHIGVSPGEYELENLEK